MGFETIIHFDLLADRLFEVTLWDLKQVLAQENPKPVKNLK